MNLPPRKPLEGEADLAEDGTLDPVGGLLPTAGQSKAVQVALGMVRNVQQQVEELIPADFEDFVYLNEAEVKALFGQAFLRESAENEQLFSHRCLVFWRTTRYLLSKAGKLQQGQSLREAAESDPELFGTGLSLGSRGHVSVKRAAMVAIRNLPVHPAFAAQPEIKRQILAAHLLVADYLEVARGSEQDPHLGVLGLRGFSGLDDAAVRNMPDASDLITFEEELVQRLLRVVYKTTRGNTLRWIKRRLGLTGPEIEEAIKLVDRAAVRERRVTPEEARAMVSQRLEHLMEVARKGLNAELELKVIKQYGDVLGLKGSVAEDANRSLLGVSKE